MESLLSSDQVMNGLIYGLLFERDEAKRGKLLWDEVVVKRFSPSDPLFGILAAALNQVSNLLAHYYLGRGSVQREEASATAGEWLDAGPHRSACRSGLEPPIHLGLPEIP